MIGGVGISFAFPCVMERIALPVFNDYLATVLDSSRRFLVVTLDGGQVRGRLEIPISTESPSMLLRVLEDFHLDAVICGAVSCRICDSLKRMGIRVIEGVRGPVDEVVAGFMEGKLGECQFRLPGCSSSTPAKRSKTGQTRGKSPT